MTEQQSNPRRRRRRGRSRGRDPKLDGTVTATPAQPAPQRGAPLRQGEHHKNGQRPPNRHQPQTRSIKNQPVLEKKIKLEYPENPPSLPGRCAAVFFDTFMQAKADLEKLRGEATRCDQLNIVIRQEGDMDDPELSAVGKVYAGAAWALIHERRQQEGWYDSQSKENAG
jgi:hypothetical protein